MKNKRGGILKMLITCILLSFAISLVFIGIESYKEYKEYKEFCEGREDFCICEYGECEFKSQWSSNEGLSKDTKDLCELAERFDDKKMIFRVGCGR